MAALTISSINYRTPEGVISFNAADLGRLKDDSMGTAIIPALTQILTLSGIDQDRIPSLTAEIEGSDQIYLRDQTGGKICQIMHEKTTGKFLLSFQDGARYLTDDLGCEDQQSFTEAFLFLTNKVNSLALRILQQRQMAPGFSPAGMPQGIPAPGYPNVIHVGCCGGSGGGYAPDPAMQLQLQRLNLTLEGLEHTVVQLAQRVEAFVGPREHARAHDRTPRHDDRADLEARLRHADLANEALRLETEHLRRENELNLRQVRLEEREDIQRPLHQAQEEVAQMRAQSRRDQEDFRRALQQEQERNREALRPLTQQIEQLTSVQTAHLRATRLLESQLQATTAFVEPLAERVHELQDQLAEQGRAAQEQLQAIREELQAQLQLSRRNLTTLKNENQALQHLVQELREELQGDRERNAGLIGRLNTIYNEQILALRERLEEVEEAGQVLERLRAEAVENLDTERAANADLRDEIERLEREHEDALAQVQDELRTAKREHQAAELGIMLQESLKSRKALEQQAHQIRAENERALQRLIQRNQILQKEIERQQEAIHQANLAAQQLQQRLDQAPQQVRDVGAQLDVAGLLGLTDGVEIDEE